MTICQWKALKMVWISHWYSDNKVTFPDGEIYLRNNYTFSQVLNLFVNDDDYVEFKYIKDNYDFIFRFIYYTFFLSIGNVICKLDSTLSSWVHHLMVDIPKCCKLVGHRKVACSEFFRWGSDILMTDLNGHNTVSSTR